MKENMKRRFVKVEMMILQKTGEINYDFDTAKKKIEEKLEEFEGAVFTEESKTYAKKIVAEPRKEKSGFSDSVKTAKTEYMRPFIEFEEKAKELISLYDKPINFINGQVQEFEENRRKEKRDLIEKIASEELKEVSGIISFQMIYNKKWENATFKEKDIREEMQAYAKNALTALSTIKSMNSPDEEEAIRLYSQTLDITKSIGLINEREAVRRDAIKREEERKKQEEIERIHKEERERIEAEIRHKRELEEAERKRKEEIERIEREKQEEIRAAADNAKSEAIEALMPDLGGESNLYEYRISLTLDAKEKLEMFMDSIGIEWEMI